MTTVVAIIFDNEEEARKVREDMAKVERMGRLSLDDSAVVVRDQEGEVHVKNEVDRGVKVGAAGGGVIGLFLGALLGGPIGAMLVGVVGGALVGKLADTGIDKAFIEDVTEALQPGTSGIILFVRESDPDVAIAALKPYKGQIFFTSLPPESEETLRRTLRKRIE